MKYPGIILPFFLFVIFAQNTFATTWEAAYPYTQQIEAQEVVVKAFSYSPYERSPTVGVTKVYYKNKLLYSIDKYYREQFFTSNDGRMLVVVHTSNAVGVTSYTKTNFDRINFNRTAIEVFKDGKPFKTFKLQDVIDTALLLNNGRFFDWSYGYDAEAYREAEWGCKSCKEIYGTDVLAKCDTSEIDLEDWEECKRECDSAKQKNIELHIFNNSIYVKSNSLFILTNQNTAVKLDFASMTIQKLPLEKVMPDKKKFYPPKFTRTYSEVKLPDKFDLPNLKDGRSIDEAIAGVFRLSVSDGYNESIFDIVMRHLVIDSKGKCVEFHGWVYDTRFPGFLSDESENKKMSAKLEKWIRKQTFQTDLIPASFSKYAFYSSVYLK